MMQYAVPINLDGISGNKTHMRRIAGPIELAIFGAK